MIQKAMTFPATVSAAPFPSIGYAMNVSFGQNVSLGKMSLPVSRASYIYSHFKHVYGVPAPEGVRGVAINKLKILDVLIEQLAQIKERGAAAEALPVSEDRIDALIEQYEGQIRQARAASTLMPYLSSPVAPAGAVFSLVA